MVFINAFIDLKINCDETWLFNRKYLFVAVDYSILVLPMAYNTVVSTSLCRWNMYLYHGSTNPKNGFMELRNNLINLSISNSIEPIQVYFEERRRQKTKCDI